MIPGEKVRKHFFLYIVIILLSCSEILAQTKDGQKYPELVKTKNNWETFFSLPGKIVMFPIKIVLEATGETIAVVDESQIVPKTIDVLTSDDGRKAVRPMFAPRTGAGLDFFVKDIFNPGSKLTFTAARGLRNRQRYQIRLKNVEFEKSGIISEFHLRYQFYSDEKFFGLGNESSTAQRTNFAQETVEFDAKFRKKLTNRFRLNLQFGYNQTNVFRGRDTTIPSTTDVYCLNILPGLGERINLANVKYELQFDSRNRLVQTSSGGVINVGSQYFTEIGGDDYKFFKLNAEVIHHLNLFYNRILVFRFAGEATESISGKMIPFFQLSELGRQETVRGYQRGRFRSNDYFLGSLEYRYPIYNKIDALLFFDTGKVSEDIFNEFSFKDLNKGYGGGFNIWGNDGIAIQFLYGRSKEGSRLYLNMNKGIK